MDGVSREDYQIADFPYLNQFFLLITINYMIFISQSDQIHLNFILTTEKEKIQFKQLKL